ncbi:MAG TPA: hypothetical protein VF756_09485 [Thermoanaerobaculia bacterium]
MVLREVAFYRYAVYAICSLPSEECQVERFLIESWQAYPKAMRDLNSMLREWTPQHGPPFEVEERAKRLRDGICEFRAREKGKKQVPRILFFEDGMNIICTSGFLKLSSTPDIEIARAVEARAEYFAHKPDRLRFLKGWGA